MVGTRLQQAVADLQKFIEMPTAVDVTAALLTPTTLKAKDDGKSINDVILNVILDISRGSKTTKSIATILKDFLSKTDSAVEKELASKILIYCDGNDLEPKNKLSPIIGKSIDKLSVMQVDTVRIMPTGRNVDAVAIFLSAIPTVEISRCVPYLTIDVQTGRPPISDTGRAQGLSFVKFLQGAIDTTNSIGDKNLLGALEGEATFAGETFKTTVSGMEMFTSPQILVDPNNILDGGRAIPAIDKFRPFMSIERLTVDVKPQVGFFSYRTANLDLTLHDRSRLSEIADFVRPDLYKHVELMLEYGWSHPDTTDDNAYAVLINSMRMKEKYGIVNASFNFTKTGEVKIKLKLFTKGFTDMQVISIAEDDAVKTAQKSIQELQAAIAAIKSRLLQEDDDKSTKEIRPEQRLFSSAEDLGASLTLSNESRAALEKFINNTSNATGDLATLRDDLKKLYIDGAKGKVTSETTSFKNKVSEVVKTRLASFKKKKQPSEADPFLITSKKKLMESLRGDKGLTKELKATTDFISFGRLMSVFVGIPLAQRGVYEDVQLIFYPFNSKAGAAAHLNVAEFPIHVDDLDKAFTELGREQGLDMPVNDFISYMANNFIDDMSAFAYGLSAHYKVKKTGPGGTRLAVARDSKIDDTQLFDRVQNQLKKINAQDLTFRMPQVDVIIETVPLDASTDGKSVLINSKRTILKIHFFDKTASAYESLGQLILSSRRDDIRTLDDGSKIDPNDHGAIFNEFKKLAVKEGLITEIPTDIAEIKGLKAYNVKYDNEKLRAFLRRNIPSIVYGTNNTGVKDASFATIQEPMLATVNMRRAGEQGPLAPQGLTKSNLPLRTLPAKVSMTTMGCPLVYFTQQFFVDFGTGTTIDNIYGVNTLSHDLTRTGFETKMDLVPLDAYGRYESLANQVGVIVKKLDEIEKDQTARAKKNGAK